MKKEYPIDKYHFYYGGNKIIATSTYAGKTVRGVAKCDPRDKFNKEIGKELAVTRCNLKIAKKRYAAADKKTDKYSKEFTDAKRRYLDSIDYFTNASKALDEAEKKYLELVKKLNIDF